MVVGSSSSAWISGREWGRWNNCVCVQIGASWSERASDDLMKPPWRRLISGHFLTLPKDVLHSKEEPWSVLEPSTPTLFRKKKGTAWSNWSTEYDHEPILSFGFGRGGGSLMPPVANQSEDGSGGGREERRPRPLPPSCPLYSPFTQLVPPRV